MFNQSLVVSEERGKEKPAKSWVEDPHNFPLLPMIPCIPPPLLIIILFTIGWATGDEEGGFVQVDFDKNVFKLPVPSLPF